MWGVHLFRGNFRLNLGFETALDSSSHCGAADDLILKDSMRLHTLAFYAHLARHELLLGWLPDIDNIVSGVWSVWVS